MATFEKLLVKWNGGLSHGAQTKLAGRVRPQPRRAVGGHAREFDVADPIEGRLRRAAT